jgi:hypothetical protein
MANAWKADDAELRKLEEAMEIYAAKARDIPSVAAVAVVPGEERDLSTYIDERDWDVSDKLMDIEDELFAKFDDVLFDFHVWYLSGQSVEDMLPSNAKVLYRRG